jgi:hypothetical protein
MPVPGSSRLARQSACLPSSAFKLLGGGPRQGPAPGPCWAAQTPELAVDDPHPGSLTVIVAFIGL